MSKRRAESGDVPGADPMGPPPVPGQPSSIDTTTVEPAASTVLAASPEGPPAPDVPPVPNDPTAPNAQADHPTDAQADDPTDAQEDLPSDARDDETTDAQGVQPTRRSWPPPRFLAARDMGIGRNSKRRAAPPKRRSIPAPPGTPRLFLDHERRERSILWFMVPWLAALALAFVLAGGSLIGLGASLMGLATLSGTPDTEPPVITTEAPTPIPDVPAREETAPDEAPEVEEATGFDVDEVPPTPSPQATVDEAPQPVAPPTPTIGDDNPWDLPPDTPALEQPAPPAAPPSERSGRRR